jgi:hypothetical protein
MLWVAFRSGAPTAPVMPGVVTHARPEIRAAVPATAVEATPTAPAPEATPGAPATTDTTTAPAAPAAGAGENWN